MVEHWNRLPWEAVTAPSLTLFKKHLGNTLRHMVWIWGCPLQGQELDLMILVGPFQFRTFHDSMILCLKVTSAQRTAKVEELNL